MKRSPSWQRAQSTSKRRDVIRVPNQVILVKFIGNLYRADTNFGTALAKTAGVELESVMKMIAKK